MLGVRVLEVLGSMLKARYAIAAAAVLFSTAVVANTGAQGPPQQPPAAPAPAPQTPAGQQPPPGRGRGPGTFPAQQRPPGDPAVIARGKGLYEVTCALCHGIDLRGGQLGDVNLLRSQVVLTDKAGEQILPIVRGARADKGMPPIPMSDEDVKAVAEYIHSIVALSPRQGMPPPPGSPPELNVLVGDATAGQAYFAAKCSNCHSATGDLQGIATRIPDPKALQNYWVSGGAAGGRGGRGGGRGAGGADQPGEGPRRVEHGEQEHEVGAGPPEQLELSRVDDELLGEDRHGHGRPDGPQVVHGAAEPVRLAQDGDRGGAAGRVGACAGHRVVVRRDRAGRGRRALHLGDQMEAGRREGGQHAPGLRRVVERASEPVRAEDLQLRAHVPEPACRDPGDDRFPLAARAGRRGSLRDGHAGDPARAGPG